MENDEDRTPRSPTYKKIRKPGKDSMVKLKQFLHETKLQDLPLDFIGTKFFNDIYLMDSILGTGSFGVVLKVVERGTGNEYAMKVVFDYQIAIIKRRYE